MPPFHACYVSRFFFFFNENVLMGMLWFGIMMPCALIHIQFGLPFETGKRASEVPTLPNIPS